MSPKVGNIVDSYATSKAYEPSCMLYNQNNHLTALILYREAHEQYNVLRPLGV